MKQLIILLEMAVLLVATTPAVAKEKIVGDLHQQLDEIEQQIEIEEADAGSAPEGQGLGEDQLAKLLEREAQKHEARKAQLAEMLKVAEEEGDEEAVARIEKLIDREQARYDKKRAMLMERGANMVYIPPCGFEMGDHFAEGGNHELPLHPVLMDEFFMGNYEVTNQQYCDYLNGAYPAQLKVDGGVVYASSDDPCDYPYCDTHSSDANSQIGFSDSVFSVRTKGGRDMSDDPMVLVSWYGAVAYCNWRSGEEGYEACYDPCDPNWPCDFSKYGYRLPTEAEWEYAARGGLAGKRFPWAYPNISHSHANYYATLSFSYDVSPTIGFHPDWNDGIEPYTSPVGTFSANGYGLYDMAGNIFEWCNDRYDNFYYDTSPYDNPTGPASGTGSIAHVLRGGSWYYSAHRSRVASRLKPLGGTPVRCNYIGFRLVLDLE